jgi:hypothetical protein
MLLLWSDGVRFELVHELRYPALDVGNSRTETRQFGLIAPTRLVNVSCSRLHLELR